MGIDRPHRFLCEGALGLAVWALSLTSACGGLSHRAMGRPDAGAASPDSVSSPDALPDSAAGDADADPCGWVPIDPAPCGCATEALQPVDPGAPCTFAIPIAPPDPNNVAVYLNKHLIPYSPTDGWQYGPTTATLVVRGSYCDQIAASPSTSVVQLLCGCPMRPPICIP
jgi:hypothetical protein